MSAYKHKSGAAKRKRKLELEESKLKLPKISVFFKSTDEEENQIREISTKDKNLSEQAGVSEAPSTENLEYADDGNISAKIAITEPVVPVESGEISTPDADPTCMQEEHNLNTYSTDKADFPTNLTSKQKRFIVDNRPNRPQGPFPRNSDKRSFSINFYTTTNKSGITTERLWLCYSTKLDQCYCQPCWLFSKSSDLLVKGFDDWVHLHQAIKRHEEKTEHNQCCAIYDKWRLNRTIDAEHEEAIRKELSIWRQILERIIDVILTLALSNMPFRGTDEQINSDNPGVFLSVIKLLAKYDIVLKNHLENHEKRSVTYLSPRIQNEIIEILGDAIKNKITSTIKSAPFFSIIVDTTQDITKIDQLSLILRYVIIHNENQKPIKISMYESFIGFFPIQSQTAETLTNEIVKTIQSNGINLQKLRGQGYDGAANMSGLYNGVQAKISQLVSNAPYVHCAAHNLNLILNDSVKNIDKVQQFYEFVQLLYVFFAHSITRWALLSSITDNSQVTLKKLAPTRWSSRHDSLYALRFRYLDILKCLSKIILTSKNKTEISEAKNLRKWLENFETIFLIVLETKILHTVNTISKLLQNLQGAVDEAVVLFNNAFNEMCKIRDEFNEIKQEAANLAKKWGVASEFQTKRIPKPKNYHDEVNNHFKLKTGEDVFRVQIFYKTIDIIISQLRTRSASLQQVADNFKAITPKILLTSSDSELFEMAENFQRNYDSDIASNFSQQLLSFAQCFKNDLKEIHSIKDLLNFILIKNYSSSSSFSEVVTACILYLTIPVTVASAERSFSKLKIIKNYLRSCMSQQRLSSLAIISIENQVARSLDLSHIISKFASAKARKKDF